MNKNAITLEGVTIGYGSGNKMRAVVANISATLKRGELTALIGNNGAGKSTLLRTLSAFQELLSGKITYPGGESNVRSAAQLSKQVAVVLTQNGGMQDMPVEEVVMLGRTPYTNFIGRTRERDIAVVEWAMREVNITHLAQRSINSISDGERQKVMIAKALAQETPVILLDEPTAFLDFSSRIQLFRLLKRLAAEESKAILVSTHDLELALQLSDTLWLIEDGKMQTGRVEELSKNGALTSFIEKEGVKYDTKTHRIEMI